jgi:hypothetical protein
VIEFFQRVETLISFAKFLASLTFMKWCTLQYMGQKFSSEIWVETLNFHPPEIPSLTPEIPGARNSAPRAGISAPIG